MRPLDFVFAVRRILPEGDLELEAPNCIRDWSTRKNGSTGRAVRGPQELRWRRRRIPFCLYANQPIGSLAGTLRAVTRPVLVWARRIH